MTDSTNTASPWWLRPAYLYTREEMRPYATPIRRDPMKILQKRPTARRMCSVSAGSDLKLSSVRASTMATASFITDSPNTIEKRSTFTPRAWNTASTVTGSVAEMREPNTRAARPPIGCEMPIWPAFQTMPPTTKVESRVPRKAYRVVGKMLSKKACRFMLYPASKMMGGSSQIMKNSKSNCMSPSMMLSNFSPGAFASLGLQR
mmetsp:Transcript_12150/g.41258  ORF Transcript_12150/g.41258 Transcript_12150/m.41258 type:complete len:204 (-) Transcript_12150:437-1048(-)